MPVEPHASGPVLICVASPKEALGVYRGLAGSPAPADLTFDPDDAWHALRVANRFELLLTNVGKANAAAALATTLRVGHHSSVLNLGIAGALPESELAIGDVVVATESIYADEGLETPDGFEDLASMGFPPAPSDRTHERGGDDVFRVLAAALPKPGPVRGRIATVSTCSGTDARARGVVSRTGALAEAMEGAALACTMARLAPCVPFCEVRVISNTTGDRARQTWDLRRALDRLSGISSVL